MIQPQLITPTVAIVGGLACQIVARKVHLPAIVPLLALGVLIGPSGLNFVQPESLGIGLRVIVGFAVAIILFEGGLTLKTESLRVAGRTVVRLVLLGSLVTWGLCSLAAHLLFPELRLGLSVLFGALVIVTGPTVIAPLLLAVKPRARVASVLRSESILIDPVGALVAVAALEFILVGPGHGLLEVILNFGWRVLVGLVIGGLGAGFLHLLLDKSKLVAHDLRNLVTLGTAIAIFVGSEAVVSESGVLAVTLGGFLLGHLKPPGIEEIEEFKSQLTILMVSMVFILLAANVPMDVMLGLGWRALLLVGLIVFVIRPIKVFLCSPREELSPREKLYVSWIGPRGIVAASVSSLFSLVLMEREVEGAATMNALVFAVIFGTVFVQGPTALPMARLLKVRDEDPTGFVIVGASLVARALGKAIGEVGVRVLLIDRNPASIRLADSQGLNSRVADILDTDRLEKLDWTAIGHSLAVTTSETVNRHAIKALEPFVGVDRGRPMLVGDPNAPATPKGLVYAFGDRLSVRELERILGAKGTIEVALVDADQKAGEIGKLLPGARALLVFDAKKRVRWIDSDDASLKAEETVLALVPAGAGDPGGDKRPTAASEPTESKVS